MQPEFHLLPLPQKIKWLKGHLNLTEGQLIHLDTANPQELLFSATRVQQTLKNHLGLDWNLTASWVDPQGQVGLTLRTAEDRVRQPQGYQLSVETSGIVIEGHDLAGVFYGTCTLIQLISQLESRDIPCVRVEDWPDIPARGVMLDISRDKVPQMKTLYDLVDRLASWKINQLQLYTEHTFAYRAHPEVWANASPMTGEEILALDAYCRERFIDLVPNQNCFGHMERWLKHSRYAPLAEIHGEFPVPWGKMRGPFSLAPVHPGSLELVRSLLDELLPHFTSRVVNVGCDETHDVGHGQSKAACQTKGPHRVYLEFVLKIYAELSRRGYKMQFWGDIIVEAPDLIPEIPGDVTGLIWGYEADHPFETQAAHFERSGVPFYVCPGTSSWNSISGRTDNALANLLNAAESGVRHKAAGYLITDWGDNGHWQVYPISFLGFMAGAAYSWGMETNRKVDIPANLSRLAFDDPSGTMGKFVYELGNIYQASGILTSNSTIFSHILQAPLEQIASYQHSQEVIQKSVDALDAIVPLLEQARMRRPDAEVIRREFNQTVQLVRFACQRAILAAEPEGEQRAAMCTQLAEELEFLKAEHASVWLERNRPGGLKDSLARFQGV